MEFFIQQFLLLQNNNQLTVERGDLQHRLNGLDMLHRRDAEELVRRDEQIVNLITETTLLKEKLLGKETDLQLLRDANFVRTLTILFTYTVCLTR